MSTKRRRGSSAVGRRPAARERYLPRETAPVDLERSAPVEDDVETPRRVSAGPGARAEARAADRADWHAMTRAEYVYVRDDVKRISILSTVLLSLMIGLWVVLEVL